MAGVEYYDVIERPVVTEKSMKDMADRKYTFLVHPDATKPQIRNAVEKMFDGVKVESVSTANVVGKTKRRNSKHGVTTGSTAAKKKAFVKLTEDSKEIEIFSGL